MLNTIQVWRKKVDFYDIMFHLRFIWLELHIHRTKSILCNMNRGQWRVQDLFQQGQKIFLGEAEKNQGGQTCA